MINTDGRIREDRRAKGAGGPGQKKNEGHLVFSSFGVVGTEKDVGAWNHGKKRLEVKPAEEVNLRGKKTVTDAELKIRFAEKPPGGKMMAKPVVHEHDGEEKPRGPPPGANLTSFERAQLIVAKAVHQDPTIKAAVDGSLERSGPTAGVYDAVKYVQRLEAARHIRARETSAGHIRSADEPSVLNAPFAVKTTQNVELTPTRFSKRMVNGPEEQEPRPFGLKRAPDSAHETPFDTKIARFYPDPPLVGKGRELWKPQGTKRLHPAQAKHDLDELAILQAKARCESHSEKEFKDFVLGQPSPPPNRGKNSSPQKNDSQISLGMQNLAPPKVTPSVAPSSEPQSMNRRNAFADKKHHSTPLW